MPQAILGISAYYHDSAAALLDDGEIVAAAQEERFSRKKHDSRFPEQAIRYCLSEAGISLADVAYVVFYDKPLVKFERLLETYLSYAPKGLRSFLAAMPIWLKEKLYLKATLKQELAENPFLELQEPDVQEEVELDEEGKEEPDDEIDWEEILLDGFDAGGRKQQHEYE